MKYLLLPTILVISLLLGACGQNENDSHQLSVKDHLIQQLIHSPEAQTAKVNEKIIISGERNYCANFDCKEYFEAYENQIQVCTNEELFMFAFRNYLVIHDIDASKGEIIAKSFTTPSRIN